MSSEAVHYPSVPMCPLCKTLRPKWCENFGEEGHPTLIGIPVCIPCADVITEYMIGMREDVEDDSDEETLLMRLKGMIGYKRIRMKEIE